MRKKLALLLMLCLLPLNALSETPVMQQEIPIQFSHPPERIADILLLPDNVLLVNSHIRRENDCLELAEAVLPDGSLQWSVPLYTYAPGHYPKERVLLLEKDAVVCLLYDQVRDRETCQRITSRISLTGDVITPHLTDRIAPAEAAKATVCGNFGIERFFDDYEDWMTPTELTHLSTGRTRSLELPGQGNFHAIGDNLLYIVSDDDGMARLWAFDQDLTMLQENVPLDFGCDYPAAAYSVQSESQLYLFVWTNRPGKDGREYTVFPVSQELTLQPALCSFNLGVIETDDFLTDYALSLSGVAACGDGFLLLAHQPWQWDKTMQHDLYYLSRTGELTLLDSFAQDDMPFLLPDGRLLMRSEAGYVLRIWGNAD